MNVSNGKMEAKILLIEILLKTTQRAECQLWVLNGFLFNLFNYIFLLSSCVCATWAIHRCTRFGIQENIFRCENMCNWKIISFIRMQRTNKRRNNVESIPYFNHLNWTSPSTATRAHFTFQFQFKGKFQRKRNKVEIETKKIIQRVCFAQWCVSRR